MALEEGKYTYAHLHFCFTATATGHTASVSSFCVGIFTGEMRAEQHEARRISTAYLLDFCTPLMAGRPSSETC